MFTFRSELLQIGFLFKLFTKFLSLDKEITRLVNFTLILFLPFELNDFMCPLVQVYLLTVVYSDPQMFIVTIEPVHEISNNVACATSKASDQPAHTRSLIRAFAGRLSIL